MTHTGKIGRLSEELQMQLNRRILAPMPDTQLLAWLNALPEVQAILARDFGGQKITRRNLAAWKSGGYQQWYAEEDAMLGIALNFLNDQHARARQTDKLTNDRQIDLNFSANPATDTFKMNKMNC